MAGAAAEAGGAAGAAGVIDDVVASPHALAGAACFTSVLADVVGFTSVAWRQELVAIEGGCVGAAVAVVAGAGAGAGTLEPNSELKKLSTPLNVPPGATATEDFGELDVAGVTAPVSTLEADLASLASLASISGQLGSWARSYRDRAILREVPRPRKKSRPGSCPPGTFPSPGLS